MGKSDLFHKDGRPKKKYMTCESAAYKKEIESIHGKGEYDKKWICAGSRCPFYSVGGCNRGGS